MVVYLAFCDTLFEAERTERRLAASCPSLVVCQILTHPRHFDAFDARLIRAADEQAMAGQITFVPPEARLESAWASLARWSLLMVAVLGASIIAATLLVNLTPEPSWAITALSGVVIGSVLFLGALALRFASWLTPSVQCVLRARYWLRQGRPVVLLISDEIFEARNISRLYHFHTPVKRQTGRAA